MRQYSLHIKHLLLVVFLGYLGMLMAFTHVHIIDGNVYVHAHPYSTNEMGDEEDDPIHHHTYEALATLQDISTFTSEELTFCNFCNLPVLSTHKLISKPHKPLCSNSVRGITSLRAPPYLIV